jgi:glycosyltransferase involved in cell wall biosynthesis
MDGVMSDPLVSVLIPAYNAARWIGETLRSAIDQTWSRKEIIVVDDGSSDNTARVVRSHECSFVQLVTQENQGAAGARNRALSLAQGDYIQWLDADDLLAPDKVARQMEAASEASPGILFSSSFATFHVDPSRASVLPGPLWKDLPPVEWITQKFANNTWMNPAVWLVSRELTGAAGPWNPELSRDDDGEYFCRVVAASEFVRFVPEARSYYRQWNAASLSRSSNTEALRSLVKSLELSVGHLLRLENSERTREAARSYLRVWRDELYPNDRELPDELQTLAHDLGGQLDPPALGAKYRLIERLFGWNAAKKAKRGAAAVKLAAKVQRDRWRRSEH